MGRGRMPPHGWQCLFLSLVVLFTSGGTAKGRELFQITITGNGATETAAFDRAEDVIQTFTNESLSEIIPGYVQDETAVAGELDFRGLLAFAGYEQADTALQVSIPCAGANLTFDGGTREASEDEFEEFLLGEGEAALDDVLTEILSCLASDTKVDFVAGNPNSLVARMFRADHRIGGITDVAPRENLVGIGIEAGGFSVDDFSGITASLPVNYSVTFDHAGAPPSALIFDGRANLTSISGAQAYDLSFASAYRLPVSLVARLVGAEPPRILDGWSITGTGRAGIVGSRDGGSLQGAAGGMVTSNFRTFFGAFGFTQTSSIGAYEAFPVTDSFGGSYDLTTVPLVNSIAVEVPLDMQMLDQRVSVEVSYLDARILSGDWAIDRWGELAASIGTRGNPTRPRWQDARLRLAWVNGDGFNAVTLGFGYRF
jgi:hypothetical protein